MNAQDASSRKGKDGQAILTMHLIRFAETACSHVAPIHVAPEAP